MLSLQQATEEAKLTLAQQALPLINLQYAAQCPLDGHLIHSGWAEAIEWKNMCGIMINSIVLTLIHRLEHHRLDPSQTCYWTLARGDIPEDENKWFFKVVYYSPPILHPIGPVDKAQLIN